MEGSRAYGTRNTMIGLATSEVEIEGYAIIGYSINTLVEWLIGVNLFSNSLHMTAYGCCASLLIKAKYSC